MYTRQCVDISLSTYLYGHMHVLHFCMQIHLHIPSCVSYISNFVCIYTCRIRYVSTPSHSLMYILPNICMYIQLNGICTFTSVCKLYTCPHVYTCQHLAVCIYTFPYVYTSVCIYTFTPVVCLYTFTRAPWR
ncbi:hypothetical protein CSUI_008908 [Cystoisospora suis]|uniref:Transmembrane protein n=1 Tax=Cystoisospora suis TaxID=483139 RepID=A0A2C6JKJ8_9APIC|nr:hypothetical protein CSUI_008908 [Cystoisospora suis]